jgi:hypothetical protein
VFSFAASVSVSPFRELDHDPAFDGNPWSRLDIEELGVFFIEQLFTLKFALPGSL